MLIRRAAEFCQNIGIFYNALATVVTRMVKISHSDVGVATLSKVVVFFFLFVSAEG